MDLYFLEIILTILDTCSSIVDFLHCTIQSWQFQLDIIDGVLAGDVQDGDGDKDVSEGILSESDILVLTISKLEISVVWIEAFASILCPGGSIITWLHSIRDAHCKLLKGRIWWDVSRESDHGLSTLMDGDGIGLDALERGGFIETSQIKVLCPNCIAFCYLFFKKKKKSLKI